MSSSFDFDRNITAWLDQQAPLQEPEHLADMALDRTRQMHQLPGWATLERWLPMETRYKFGAIPRTGLILVTLGLLLVLASAIAAGQQPSPRLLEPLGPARNGLIAYDDGGDIYVVNPDGNGPTALTSGPDFDSAPEWSSDGTQIAYFSQQTIDGPAAIKVMDANGQNVRKLVDGITLASVSWRVSWSHDGQHLAYAEQQIDGQRATDRIMVVPVAGGDPVEVADPGQAPTWSSDDQLIAYRSWGVAKDGTAVPQGLSIVAPDGTGRRLVDGMATQNPWAYAYPQWSSDGTRLAYHATPIGGPNTIYLAAVDGSARTTSGDPALDLVWPLWSPDDKRIAAIGAADSRGPFRISVFDPDGSHGLMPDHPAVGCNCAFEMSPDGTKVAVWFDGPTATESSLMIVDVASKEQVVKVGLSAGTGSNVSWQRLAP